MACLATFGPVRCPPMNPDMHAEADPASLASGLYEELRRTARGVRMGHQVGDTLQTTALIHEAWLKLARSGVWLNRQHFLFAAAQAMRQVVVDAARARLTVRRGGGQPTRALDGIDDFGAADPQLDEQLLDLHAALQRLAALNPRLVQVVECRYFAGYSELETAEALGITDRTARRDWVKARAWLFRELSSRLPTLPG